MLYNIIVLSGAETGEVVCDDAAFASSLIPLPIARVFPTRNIFLIALAAFNSNAAQRWYSSTAERKTSKLITRDRPTQPAPLAILAQLVEQPSINRYAGGSSPPGGSTRIIFLLFSCSPPFKASVRLARMDAKAPLP